MEARLYPLPSFLTLKTCRKFLNSSIPKSQIYNLQSKIKESSMQLAAMVLYRGYLISVSCQFPAASLNSCLASLAFLHAPCPMLYARCFSIDNPIILC